ncbi:hypothetical protein EEL31_01990 [Brevibacillus laterosporus]|nr:hypothetical protein [Brevibacillus laterosporus]TPG73168.1 hypothetical protein EEL31_01990 [Brevibacillus laterosporus]
MRKVLSLMLGFTLLSLVTVQPFAYGKTVDKGNEREVVESYKVDYLSDEPNAEGYYEELGYKEVNSIINVERVGDEVFSKAVSLEDIYDLEGDYVKTELKASEFVNNYETGKAKLKELKKEFEEKKTVGDEEGSSIYSIIEKTDVKKEIKENISELIEQTDFNSSKFENIEGITFEDIEKVKGEINKEVNALKGDDRVYPSCNYVECGGAFDTYYNYDPTNGKFVVQALSETGHEYVKIKGTTSGSKKNATGYKNFKQNVDKFEEVIIEDMRYDVLGNAWQWWKVIMGLSAIIAGATHAGPVGWVALVAGLSSIYALFEDLTDAEYATSRHLNYSSNAAKYNQNCRNALYYKNFENIKSSIVDGY